jgi:hypothetical protein
MIDVRVVQRAQNVLARAAAIKPRWDDAVPAFGRSDARFGLRGAGPQRHPYAFPIGGYAPVPLPPSLKRATIYLTH